MYEEKNEAEFSQGSNTTLEFDFSKISSTALSRLVEEVRKDDNMDTSLSYDRVHNRHNR